MATETELVFMKVFKPSEVRLKAQLLDSNHNQQIYLVVLEKSGRYKTLTVCLGCMKYRFVYSQQLEAGLKTVYCETEITGAGVDTRELEFLLTAQPRTYRRHRFTLQRSRRDGRRKPSLERHFYPIYNYIIILYYIILTLLSHGLLDVQCGFLFYNKSDSEIRHRDRTQHKCWNQTHMLHM